MNSPPPIAVALTYDEESPPFVSAKGRGLIADEILRIAREHNILIHEDPALVEALALLELGQEIPESLFKAIAEVIAFAYSLRGDESAPGLKRGG
ncbi:EscU/YscU/HrcU family type III secretion system export apparatus switch protein [Motiliproteus sediminis]|uniref:EscU/YscU/HrcU family type III secretion system export apparatus switch protein n=1 Tax=Motiliproteus sediminis TaxID=1468178 RepID=UPI001AEFB1D5|nr:EscU/YscU/HrcU family type III secretion system export apparatus switch protein [Motiliproteus sediminis]